MHCPFSVYALLKRQHCTVSSGLVLFWHGHQNYDQVVCRIECWCIGFVAWAPDDGGWGGGEGFMK